MAANGCGDREQLLLGLQGLEILQTGLVLELGASHLGGRIFESYLGLLDLDGGYPGQAATGLDIAQAIDIDPGQFFGNFGLFRFLSKHAKRCPGTVHVGINQ